MTLKSCMDKRCADRHQQQGFNTKALLYVEVRHTECNVDTFRWTKAATQVVCTFSLSRTLWMSSYTLESSECHTAFKVSCDHTIMTPVDMDSVCILHSEVPL